MLFIDLCIILTEKNNFLSYIIRLANILFTYAEYNIKGMKNEKHHFLKCSQLLIKNLTLFKRIP